MKPNLREALLPGACAAICAIQLLFPGYIGIANNGDWGRVFARFDCSPPDLGARNFIYFVPDYEFDPKYHWAASALSSEIVLAAGPILLVRAAGAHVFNIRWLGALHASLFVAAYYALLLHLRRYGPAVQTGTGVLALWIFADVAYVSYYNSFYSDTAAMLGLLLMAPLALSVAAGAAPTRLWFFALAATLFITSKPQHGLWGFLPALLALALTWRSKPARAGGVAVCALLLVAAAAVLRMSPPGYLGEPLFSVIFHKLAPGASEPRAALRELGLEEADARYIGMHAYSPGSPMSDLEWKTAFGRRTSYRRVATYWLRHPRQALEALDDDLEVNAPMIRAPNLSNFRREDGHPAGARAHRFESWSNLRAWLYVIWPRHIAAWYVLLAAVGAILWKRTPAARPDVAICLGIALMATGEFLFASLADAVETHRHLLLFHLMTDITFCFAAGWSMQSVSRRLGLGPSAAGR